MCRGGVQISKRYPQTIFRPESWLGFGVCEETSMLRECPYPKKVTAAPFKRKRPARIDIPALESGIGVETPRVVEGEKEMMMEDIGYTAYCRKGRRHVMEDRYSAVLGLQGDSKKAFFGVFDGHGGPQAAEFAANNLNKNIMEELSGRCQGGILDAIRNGYLNTDSEFLKEDVNGGACCVTALIQNGKVVVSNAGDCRAVLSRAGIAEALTSDHKPSREDERDRIESQGGYVDCCHGVWRVQGSLAVSRAIGDQRLKRWVTAEPETKVLRIEPEFEFLLLGTDGLWDKVSNQEAVDVVQSSCIGVEKTEPFAACKKLVDLSIRRGSIDDISVMIIQLDCFLR